MKKYTLSLLIAGLACISCFAQVSIKRCGGWFETAYVEWELYSGADMYNVYYKSTSSADWIKIDDKLVRNYGYYGRADVMGISAGVYDLKVVATSNGAEITGSAKTINNIAVEAHDRAGFAFMNGVVPGAYKADGTLKDNAKVFYVDNSNFNTIEWTINKDAKGGTQKCVGVQGILAESTLKLMKYNDNSPICIRIIGEINLTGFPSGSWGSSAEGLSIKGDEKTPMNITIEGVGEDACVNGFGIFCRSTNSVEIRNLGVMNVKDDDISLDTDNYYTWVHNLDLYYGNAGSDSDQAKGDGTVDVKGDSKYQTYSYNHFWDSGKCSLCGMKSESGPNYITYHHNWFDHSDSRHPRVRTMTVHVYNNYYDGVAKYGVGATTGSNVFVEANYFRNTNRPMMSSKQGTDATGDGTFSGETGGMIKAYGNQYVECGKNFSYITANEVSESAATAVSSTSFDAYEASTRNEKVPASYKTLSGGTTYSNFDTDASVMPSYTADKAVEVPAKVKNYAGRLNGGDIVFVFNNSVDDASYAVNADLKSMIKNYKTSLVSIASFTKTSSAPKTYTVTFLNEDGTEFEVISGLTKVEYPATTPNAEVGYTFTGWNVARGQTLTADIEVYPTFSDGSNTEGEGVGGVETINAWDFTSWSSDTKTALASGSYNGITWTKPDQYLRYKNSAITKGSFGFGETEGLLFSGQGTVSYDATKGSYIQGTIKFYIPASVGETITIVFANTGNSNGTRYLSLNGTTNIASSGNTTKVTATINVTADMIDADGYIMVYSTGGLNYFSIKRTFDASTLVKPTFKYSEGYCEVDKNDNTTWVYPTLTSTSDNTTVVYTSSNTDVATIDAAGNITLIALGSTTISAKVDHTNTYRAASAKYTLKVKDSSISTYTVKYMADGELFAQMEEQYVVVYPEDIPEKEGYRFTGWSVVQGTAVTSDLSINAIFEEVQTVRYTVKFLNADGSVFEQMDDQEKVVYPTTNPTKDGYIFKGWNVSAGETLTNDIEIEPVFEEATDMEYVLYATAKNTYNTCSGFYTMNTTETGENTLTYNNVTYSPCIKCNSKCKIEFTTPSAMKMTIIMLTAGNFKLNEVATAQSVAENNYYKLEIDLAANTKYTLTRNTTEYRIACLFLTPITTATPMEAVEANREIVNIEYYGINGSRQNGMSKGVNIVRTVYSNGSAEVQKIIK